MHRPGMNHRHMTATGTILLECTHKVDFQNLAYGNWLLSGYGCAVIIDNFRVAYTWNRIQ